MSRWSERKNWWMNVLGRLTAAGIAWVLYLVFQWLRTNWPAFLGFLQGGVR